MAISAVTLIEIAVLSGPTLRRLSDPHQILALIESNSAFQILPLTIDIAREIAFLARVLRDPSDTAIVATARVHGLRLLTSDQRILAANLVSTIA